MGHKLNHLAAWSISFAAASLGVWMTWLNYVSLGLRFRVPDWVPSHERPLFLAELLGLGVGTLITAYRSGAFAQDPHSGAAQS